MMRRAELTSVGPAVGFLLLDDALNPIVLNRAAAEILCYPQPPDIQRHPHRFWAEKVHALLVGPHLTAGSPIVAEFRSGRRRYLCRSFRLDTQVKGYSKLSIAVLLERESSTSFSMVQVARTYHLTPREQEVLRFLMEGLTSKEIAGRMDISANTVKAFLRLIMTKMGVTTRSGILGKALTTLPESTRSSPKSEKSFSGLDSTRPGAAPHATWGTDTNLYRRTRWQKEIG